LRRQVYGKIQYVTSGADFKVQVVDSFPDLKVQEVTSFPDKAGKWQVVTSGAKVRHTERQRR